MCVSVKKGLSVVLFGILLVSTWADAGHPGDESGEMEMDHGTVSVPAGLSAPELAIDLYPDNMDGYNLKLVVNHFTIIPPLESLIKGSAANVVEGHAHLYVNGKKIQRVYSLFTHLPAKLFRTGINAITLSLNDHNHATWTVEKSEIQATLTVNVGREPLVLNHFSSSPIRKRPH
jgi:hypothetical protein